MILSHYLGIEKSWALFFPDGKLVIIDMETDKWVRAHIL